MEAARSHRRDGRVALLSGLVAAIVTVLALALTALPAMARAGASTRGLHHPRHNRHLRSATLTACQSSPDSAICVRLAVADINAARASEGVRPMRLPRRFRSLTGPQQLMVLSNLERIGRGLQPVLGLAAPLNRDARRGALAHGDPSPSHLDWQAYTANFAYGYSSTLESAFEWMYDDGYGSFNIDCRHLHDIGCWGHRDDILAKYGPPIVMGAAVVHTSGAVVMTELFVFGDSETGPGQPDHPLAPTWSSIH